MTYNVFSWTLYLTQPTVIRLLNAVLDVFSGQLHMSSSASLSDLCSDILN